MQAGLPARGREEMPDPNRFASVAQLDGSPRRRYYTGRDLRRAVAIADLRAMAHRRLPRFVLEYLEGGAEEEATLAEERMAYGRWRFLPRQLVDVSQRSLHTQLLGAPAALPLVIAPTGFNGLFHRQGDIALAQAAARGGVPFVQSTMSNDPLDEVAQVPGLRHWWQLYVFGGDEVWQELLRRVEAAGCEALVLTTNAQIFGNREWSARTRASPTRPSVPTLLDAALHPRWVATTLLPHGLPAFRNVIEFIPREHRGLMQSAFWIRAHQPTSLSWQTLARIRQRWRRPLLLKGVLRLDDVRRAIDAGVEGVVLGSHGGRQLDGTVAALDLLPAARALVQGPVALYVSGGLRRGTDLLKALALGADAVLAGRAPLYGLCAGGSAGASRALEILQREAHDALGLLGARSVGELGPQFLAAPLSCEDPASTRKGGKK
ncbi:MAG TPA: alpha-hydroxy acid oxidase [Ramlibacter sp.]|uniref:alpha-hydroxy acid oxidase n=1 Tax=Ramlibacter sp. TaxID=1917967 RepID=UPI002D809F0C|nr:alpha-hydroxy acid oxidase [Ramlibacter sp.]HET8747723.1 alpha-hydroxy acid oxidase [Ramlibacter sp.]